jgi:hypothetical protein
MAKTDKDLLRDFANGDITIRKTYYGISVTT